MNFLKIEECESNNGYGFGTTLYVSGCPRRCAGCFNRAGWSRKAGKRFTETDFLKLEKCLEQNYIQRLSFSGGDPLAPWNRAEVLEICARVKEKFGKKIITWIYTGYQLDDFRTGAEGFQQCRGLTSYDGSAELENGFLKPKTDFFEKKNKKAPEGGGEFRVRNWKTENGFFDLMGQYIDFVVDGEYREKESHVKPFRGSDNQILWRNRNGVWWRVE